VNAQLADLRGHIDQQVRTALLDVGANAKLVEVARSNVELATRALSDETDRVNAGVDDNLPLVTAQAALASAENNQVESLYQYNLSKLALARAAGVLERSTGFTWDAEELGPVSGFSRVLAPVRAIPSSGFDSRYTICARFMNNGRSFVFRKCSSAFPK